MPNLSLQETKIHGTFDFPYVVYHGRIPDFMDSFPCHWHDEAELIYIVSGQVRITVWSVTYHARPGDILILMPHTLHAIEGVDSDHAEYYNIVFHFSILGSDSCSEKYLKPFIAHEKTVNCYEPDGSKLNTRLKPLILSLIENRRNTYATHEYLVKSHLFMIMHLLNQSCATSSENERALHWTYSKLKTALYHIQNSYAGSITIKDVSALCGFSESHFMKLFKEMTGMSFTAYLIQYRLELAAQQLTQTDLKVIEIAANCGFRNHSYFTRSFLKKYGITPVKYRNLHKERHDRL